MVHEQERIASLGPLQFLPEPPLAPLAIEAGVGPVLNCIKKQKPSHRNIERGLGESGVVEVLGREGLSVRLPVVMISDKQADQQLQRRQCFRQIGEGFGLSPVCEVSGQDQKLCVGVVER